MVSDSTLVLFLRRLVRGEFLQWCNQCRSEDWQTDFNQLTQWLLVKGFPSAAALATLKNIVPNVVLIQMLPVQATGKSSKSARLGCWSRLSAITDAEIDLSNQLGFMAQNLSL